jgi:hypothetical protein
VIWLLRADVADAMAYDHPRGRKPVMRYPECQVRHVPVQRVSRDGTETRSFRFHGRRDRCEHRAAKAAVVVIRGETTEHQWIKNWAY